MSWLIFSFSFSHLKKLLFAVVFYCFSKSLPYLISTPKTTSRKPKESKASSMVFYCLIQRKITLSSKKISTINFLTQTQTTSKSTPLETTVNGWIFTKQLEKPTFKILFFHYFWFFKVKFDWYWKRKKIWRKNTDFYFLNFLFIVVIK